MICRYEIQIVALCPVDEQHDVYSATLISDGTIPCEKIVKEIRCYRNRRMFQEEITQELANTLKCQVTTVGMHSGVKTTVEATP